LRVKREALVARAVATLEEALSECGKAPVPPRPGLRLAVAYLYAISDDKAHYGHHPRQAFDEFMLAVTDTKVTDMPEKDGRGRRAVATAAYNHILRRVGARR